MNFSNTKICILTWIGKNLLPICNFFFIIIVFFFLFFLLLLQIIVNHIYSSPKGFPGEKKKSMVLYYFVFKSRVTAYTRVEHFSLVIEMESRCRIDP